MNAIALIEDGRHDFDFLHGEWRVAHRRLKRRGAACQAWEDFTGATVCRSLMGGTCNVDETHMPVRGYAGVTFRAFDVARRTGSIYGVNAAEGVVGEPVHGRFEDGLGCFYGVKLDDGRPVQVALVWMVQGPDQAHWSQAFSYDLGRTWEENWTMDFTRIPERG
jgi:hypothetical protein